MVKHVVMFKFKGTDEERLAVAKAFRDALVALPAQIGQLRSIDVGINVNPAETWDLDGRCGCLFGPPGARRRRGPDRRPQGGAGLRRLRGVSLTRGIPTRCRPYEMYKIRNNPGNGADNVQPGRDAFQSVPTLYRKRCTVVF